MTGVVTNIQRFSTHDGPGVRTTVFVKGCPLRCIWCHNPETYRREAQVELNAARCVGCGACVEVCSAHCHVLEEENGRFRHLFSAERCVRCFACVDSCAYTALKKIGEEKTPEEVMRVVLLDRPFYGKRGGLTVSGGEPMMQPDFTLTLLRLAREEGISTCIESCGVGIERLDDALCDTIYFDIKAVDAALHRRITGRDNAGILANLESLASRAAEKIILRSVIAVGYTDTEQHVLALRALAQRLGIARVELNPFHPYGSSKAEAVGLERIRLGKEIIPDDDRLRALRRLLDNNTL